MLRKKVFLYVSFVKSVQFVCAIIKVTIYFQLIASKCRISNNLLQATKNFPIEQIC